MVPLRKYHLLKKVKCGLYFSPKSPEVSKKYEKCYYDKFK